MLQSKKRILPRCLLLAAIYLFLLLLSYGFPVTGDDWFFTSRFGWTGLGQAIYHGYTLSVSHALAFNGRYIGNFLVGLFTTSRAFCLAVTCLIILLEIALVWRVCRVRKPWACVVSAVAVVCLPASLYSQTYAWSAGFFNYVPSALLVLLYLDMVDRHFARQTPRRSSVFAIVMALLLGLVTQFFVENISVGMCLLSAGVLVYSLRKKQFTWKFAAYLIGAIAGCVLMFLAPGYRHIGTETETYRTIASGLLPMLETAVRNANQMVTDLFGTNPLVIVPLTLFCLCPQGVRTRKGRVLQTLCVLLPPLYFAANALVLQELAFSQSIQILAAVLQCAMGAIYLTSITWYVCSLRERELKSRLLLLLLGICATCAPLFVVSPVTSRCIFLPQLLLTCMTLMLGRDFLQKHRAAERYLRLPLLLVSATLLICYLWIAFWNGRTETLRLNYTKEMMAQGAKQITLTDYPYEDFVFGTQSDGINYYYYYETPGDITFRLLPYEAWQHDAVYAEDINPEETPNGLP